jgi:polyhydroxyalkanoate synthesis regulator phasin
MTAENIATVEQAPTAPEEERPLVVGAVSKLLLASIGAIGLAQDGIERVLNRMVERGHITQQDAQRLMHEMRENRPGLFRRSVNKAASTVLDTTNLPSRSDILTLHEEIAALSAKIDQMSMEGQASATAARPKEEAAKPAAPKVAGK